MSEQVVANQVRSQPGTFCGEVEQWRWQLCCYGLLCVLTWLFDQVGWQLFPGVLSYAVGLIVLAHFLYRVLRWAIRYKEIQKANILQREGQLIEAFVVNRWTNHDAETGTTYSLAYQLPGGVPTAHSLGTWEGLPLGRRILVLYAPSNPAWSQVVSDSSSYQLLRTRRAKLLPPQRLGDLWSNLSDVAIGEQFALPASVVPGSKKDYASSS